MPSRSRNLFISHAWLYSDRYDGVVRLLNNADNFQWKNHSVPQHDPAIDPNTDFGRNKLIQALRNQIQTTNCIIVVAGMYVNARYWIQKEIEIAKGWNKPIVSIRRRGQQRTPQDLVDISDKTVNWNTSSLVSAIREVS